MCVHTCMFIYFQSMHAYTLKLFVNCITVIFVNRITQSIRSGSAVVLKQTQSGLGTSHHLINRKTSTSDCWTQASRKVRQTDRSCVIRIRIAFPHLIRLSLHLIRGLPTLCVAIHEHHSNCKCTIKLLQQFVQIYFHSSSQ